MKIFLKSFSRQKIILVALVFVSVILGFQNCNRVNFQTASSDLASSQVDQGADPFCTFNGSHLSDGQSVTAFQGGAVPYGQKCISEERICQSGVLSGSFTFPTCQVAGPFDCLFGGHLVLNGKGIVAYQNSTTPPGQPCLAETRICSNGVLSGSYNYTSCVPTPANCSFNGNMVGDGQSVTAYQASQVPFGQSCIMEKRMCSNGNLSGSYLYSSCSVLPAADCPFNGSNIKSGTSVTAYATPSVPFGQNCQSQLRTCSNGNLSGTFAYSSCSVNGPASCQLGQQNISSGSSITAYLTDSVPFGQQCSSQVRTCNNGVLSGSYTNLSCMVKAAAPCSFNGQSLPNGQGVDAYETASVPFGFQCNRQTRVCNNGVLSGSFTFASCSVSAPASCLFNGQTIAHGDRVQAFSTSSVKFGAQCQSQMRTCYDGVLSGSYAYASCEVGAPASCLFNGQTIAHGQSVNAFLTSTVPFGNQCQMQSRTCNNGVLSGNYTYANCNVGAPASCLFNGQTIAHGQSVTAFNAATVPAGSQCQSESRVCNNGALSGDSSYSYASCRVLVSCWHPNSMRIYLSGGRGQDCNTADIYDPEGPTPGYGYYYSSQATCNQGASYGAVLTVGANAKICFLNCSQGGSGPDGKCSDDGLPVLWSH